ncbi:TIGR03085 family metal-binding protein [Paractinoplanes atraurantiacus]|uniref:TIGR03085 family metal-binding protein n=1 Tax=Paractinoplanes atraurantiacus TaxID=1036182 RepID=UPI000BE3E277|nr:TIGR03085 family metal-binding protein [Actinoplanes atraurantiacus]
MTAYARSERRLLADLLLSLGPDQPTLCEGWTTRDLAAHLVVRDRRPDASAGILLPPLHGHGERVRLAKASQPYEKVISELRTPPWWSPVSNPLLDEVTNVVEFFVHHEDARRAQPSWEPRSLSPGEETALWKAVRMTAKLALRRARLSVEIRSEGFGSLTVGPAPIATLSGNPGEIALFLTGRKDAARVDITGDAARLRDASLGL